MENIIAKTATKISKGLESIVNPQPMNEYYGKKRQAIRATKGVQNRQSAVLAQKIAQQGGATPEKFSTIKTPGSFIIQIDTTDETGDTRVVIGKGERFFSEIDTTWVSGQSKSVVANQANYERFLDALNTDTIEFGMLVLKAAPSNTTDAINADLQLDAEIRVHQFGMESGDYTRRVINPYFDNDPNAQDQLTRVINLSDDILKSRWNAYTCWELVVKPNVVLSLGLVTDKRINGRY